MLVPDCRRTCSSTVPVPFTLAMVSGSASPSSTRATSEMRIGMAVLLANDDVVELGDGLDAAAGPQGQRLRSLIDASARNLDVLRLQGAGDVIDRQVIGAQPIGIEPHIDLTLPSAEDQHLADAVDALELAAQHLVCVFSDVANRLVGAQRQAEDRRRVRIEAIDARLLNRLRQQRQDAVDLVAHFLRGDVGVLVER